MSARITGAVAVGGSLVWLLLFLVFAGVLGGAGAGATAARSGTAAASSSPPWSKAATVPRRGRPAAPRGATARPVRAATSTAVPARSGWSSPQTSRLAAPLGALAGRPRRSSALAPPSNITPVPDFLLSCSAVAYDDSARCVGATLAALDRARGLEGVGPMSLPPQWDSLSPSEQLFVATDLERTSRGMPPLEAQAIALEQTAAAGAGSGADPVPPPSMVVSQWGSSWAGALGNPLEAIYFWMYDDGPGSPNVACGAGELSQCWAHRDNILMALPCHECVMGTAFDTAGWRSQPTWAEILAETSGPVAVDFSWRELSSDQ